ncbi:MAG: DUF1800 domain-containing protein [Bacteroidia bacterium]|nr:DUF1800 domain-containing protein [Bacteroidia bacterium]
MERRHIQHLYWRAGFGLRPEELNRLSGLSRDQIVNDLFDSSRSVHPLRIDLSEFNGFRADMAMTNKKELREFIERSRVRIKDFNYAWVNRMVNPKAALRERMTLFWANHFVCRDSHIGFVQQYNNTLRKHALGHFGDFVKAISKQPAMLKYLNNKHNIKKSPNENFARELMELFTLGPGHYTERDIKESARALTGYFHDFKGRFVFRYRQHDMGVKRFLGYRGRFTGDDVVNIILAKRQCARFICEKIYAYFVNETLVQDHIDQMVEVFYRNYKIDKLMRFVFQSDWFYDEKNIGSKIKSPVELIVGIRRTVPIEFRKINESVVIQRYMGQPLLYPPNVAGWKGGRSWINTNTLLLRLKTPSILLSNGIISIKEQGQFFDPMFDRFRPDLGGKKIFDVVPDWDSFESEFKGIDIEEMTTYMLQTSLSEETSNMLNDLSKLNKKTFCVQLMSLPEYQMC